MSVIGVNKENFEKEWAKEEQVLRDEHPRK